MRVLIAIDGSESSASVVRAVAECPWPSNTELRVLAVVEYPVYGLTPPIAVPPPGMQQIIEQGREQLQSLVASATSELKRSELKGASSVVTSTIRSGDPRVEIIDEAENWKADLIVMGSHGRTGLKRWLMGSVAEHVVRHAPCSVEVVRRRPRP